MIALSPGVTLAWEVAALEAAAGLHAEIEPDHLTIGLCSLDRALEAGGLGGRLDAAARNAAHADASAIRSFFEDQRVNLAALRRTLRTQLGRGAGTPPDRVVHRGPACKAVFERASHLAEELSQDKVGVLHLLAAALDAPTPALEAALVRELRSGAQLRQALSPRIAVTRPVTGPEPLPPTPFPPPAPIPPTIPPFVRGTPMLDRFGRDLTREASEGKLRPVIGRRDEMLQTLRVLSRQTKNNPVLVGEAGVGKTAVVEGLAQRIAEGKDPALAGRRIVELKLAALVAGTRYRGDFEERLVQLLDEARVQPEVILFVDELHTVIAAGDSEGGLDVANILKPALARGDLTCIGATTEVEYRRHIARDAALERRFQPVRVAEPTPDEARQMLLGLAPSLAAHHGVAVEPAALDAAVDLTVRYLPARRLPDKAIDALDEACARVKAPALSQASEIGETAPVTVTRRTVAEVVQSWTGIPIHEAGPDDVRLTGLEAALGRRIVGQDAAIERVARRVRRAQAGLADPDRPLGVFLFVGPTGVGKTELARALAAELFGSTDALIRLDMSEYAEKHDVTRLLGAPPGYVGHGEEGELARRLRTTPYAVVLLDEAEKAHPEIWDVFLQVFDAGRLTDASGATVDARHALFILTSNLLPTRRPRRLGFAAAEPDVTPDDAEVRRYFRPELVNRIDAIVPFRPLGATEIAQLARARLAHLSQRLLRERDVIFDTTDEAIALLARFGHDGRSGARELNRVVERLVEEPLADRLAAGELLAGERIVLRVDGERLVFARDFGTL